MNEKDKRIDSLKIQINLFELQLKELRSTSVAARPDNYDDQLVALSRRIKALRNELNSIING